MGNSSHDTKVAIARLKGSDLPDFIPASISEEVASLVRECILESTNSKMLKVTSKVHELLTKQLSDHRSPKYTVPQYILMVLCTVSTTSNLIRQHNSGSISDREFIEQIKNAKNNNGARASN
jgi:hypothetical protein